MILLLILALLVPPAPPDFTAHWARPHVAALRWSQPASVRLTCLSKNATLLRCWSDLPAGATALTLGDTGPLDATAHVAAGDVFSLQHDQTVVRARLRSVSYLGVMRR